jgi:peroxiredoxin
MIAVAAIAVTTFAVAACGRAGDVRAPAIGARAPEFTAMDLEGKPVALAELTGNVVVLNVWATWCRPCLEEVPQLQALHAKYASQGVRMVGVSIDAAGMGADVKDFMTEHGMGYTVWLDPEHQFQLKFLTVGVPETFVIDRTGVIRARVIGALRNGDTTLTTSVERALAEP